MELLNSTVKSVFLFVLDLDSITPVNPTHGEPARSRGGFSKLLLELVIKELTKSNYRLSNVELSKMGMAGCVASLPSCKVEMGLGVDNRSEVEATLMTHVRTGRRTSQRQLSANVQREWAEFCQDVERTLSKEFKLSSLQRLTQQEAEALWKGAGQAPHP
jgi:hypothetical protein